MTQSARLGLPFIADGQVGKAATHNEALALADLAIAAAVEGVLVNMPPPAPDMGDCYVVGSAPTGAWAGHSLALAGYTQGGWRFVEAREGLSVLDKASGQIAAFTAGAWETGHVRALKLTVGADQVVGPRLEAVPDPVGGTTADAEARAAIAAILARLRQHGLIAE